MTAATCQTQIATGASPSYANAETGGVFDKADSLTATTPVTVSSSLSPGTHYSWIKNFVLDVTVAGTTTITNRKVYLSGNPAQGLYVFWKAVAIANYAQAASGTSPTDSTSNGAVPAGYTLMTTTKMQYDGSSFPSTATGPNGNNMIVCVLGVDNTYADVSGNGVSLPSIEIDYDEF